LSQNYQVKTLDEGIDDTLVLDAANDFCLLVLSNFHMRESVRLST